MDKIKHIPYINQYWFFDKNGVSTIFIEKLPCFYQRRLLLRLLLVFACLIPSFTLFGQIESDTTNKEQINLKKRASILQEKEATPVNIAENDSTQTETDTAKISPISTFDISGDQLDETIEYEAEDSIIYDIITQKVYLYGNASVQQGPIKLTAAVIELDQKEQVVFSYGTEDSLGNWTGKPRFTDGEQDFGSDQLTYSFKTNKGKLAQMITRQQDGLLRSEEVVKNDRDELFGKRAYYTTCTHENPHYRIEAKKVKIVPDELIVTGPAQLYIDKIPTPLVLPFGIFPLTDGRRSGVLLPSYGFSPGLGYYLSGGGLYLGINDYVDFTLRGDIYTRGTWSVNARSSYRKRYRYNGSFSFTLGKRNSGDIIEPSFSITRDYRLSWQHAQDPKARPNRTFSASVNLGTSTYARNFVTSTNSYLSNTLNSSISYSRSFPGSPFNLSLSANHSQNTQTRSVRVTLPELAFNMRRIQPFKKVGKAGRSSQWIRKAGVSYRLNARNQVNTVDSLFFTDQVFEDMRNGVKHSIPVSTSFNIFKYFNVSPSFNFNEYWYLESSEKKWDPTTVYDTTFVSGTNEISQIDTTFGSLIENEVSGFASGRDFNFSVGLTTRIYGTTNKLKIGRIRAFRHVMRPSISYSWRPDFSDEFWGYYKDVQTNEFGDTNNYSIFENGIFGGPGRGKSNSLSLSIDNNFEMKTAAKNDTTGELKLIKLFESISLNTSYNFAADSLKMSNININGRATILNKIRFNFNSSFNPYAVDDSGSSYNKFYWNDQKKLARLNTINLAFGINLGSKKTKGKDSKLGTPEERRDVLNNLDDYINFNIPWSLSLDYSLRITRRYLKGEPTNDLTQTLNGNLDFNLTPQWKINVRTGYDFVQKELAYTRVDIFRTLHCWSMGFNWVPNGQQRRYEFVLRANSALLQDLKLQRRRNWYDF